MEQACFIGAALLLWGAFWLYASRARARAESERAFLLDLYRNRNPSGTFTYARLGRSQCLLGLIDNDSQIFFAFLDRSGHGCEAIYSKYQLLGADYGLAASSHITNQAALLLHLRNAPPIALSGMLESDARNWVSSARRIASLATP